MDDFQWLEDKPSPKRHHQWLKDYWLHILAVVVIATVLLLLVFNPASKSINPKTGFPATETIEQPAQENTLPKKQILIRMPDKSTKKIETSSDGQMTSLPVPTRQTPPATTIIKPSTTSPEEPSLDAANSEKTKEPATTSNSATPKKSIPLSLGNLANTTKPAAPTLNPSETAPKTDTTIESLNEPVEESANESTSQSISKTENTTTKTTEPAKSAAPVEPVKTIPNTQTTITNTTKPSTTSKPQQAQTPTPATPKQPAAAAAPHTDSALNVVLKRNPSHYTLQLFGSDNEASVKSFIEKHQLQKTALYVAVWHGGKTWYVVISGDYANRNQAQVAIQSLPQNLQANSPWPRSIQSIQEAVRDRLIREGMD